MDNDELIQKYDDISTEQLQLLSEILIRYQSNQLTEEQWVKVNDIASRSGAYLIDLFAKGRDKEEIKQAVNNVIDTCTDVNR